MDTEAVNANSGIDRSSIWFADGGIVLQAEKTRFCVHSGVLSMHSVVFRDMLTFPQGDAPIEQVDGRPLVRVSDRADDMVFLLQALYDPSPLPRMSLNAETTARLCAVLRLSTKYMILHLRTAVSHAFNEAYPSDLSSWDKSPLKVPTYKDGSWVVWPFELNMANSLTQAQLRSPLPILFYRLTRGMKQVAIFESDLDLANKKTIFASYERCQSRRSQFFSKIFSCETEGECVACTSPMCKFSALLGIVYLPSLGDFGASESNELGASEALDFDFKEIVDNFPTMKMCKPCRGRWITASAASRADYWQSLPDMFAMGNWDALRQADADYLENMAATRPTTS